MEIDTRSSMAPDQSEGELDVMQRLAVLGETVASGVVRLTLSQSECVWLVTAGSFDLFAADSKNRDAWQFLGRLDAGDITLGGVLGSSCHLLARPDGNGSMSSVPIAELARAQHEEWRHGRRGDQRCSDVEWALATGLERGLSVLVNAVREGERPAVTVDLVPGAAATLTTDQVAAPLTGICWIDVRGGKVTGATVDRRTHEAGELLTITETSWITCLVRADVTAFETVDLMLSGRLWDVVSAQQALLLGQVERMLAHSKERAEERLAAGRAASSNAILGAGRKLRVAAGAQLGAASDALSDGRTIAACRIVAKAARITIRDIPTIAGTGEEVPIIDRLGVASGFRTRSVRLTGAWWRDNVGPLVGSQATERMPVALLWRRGAYQLVNPETGAGTRVTASLAASISEEAVMFYRPLPDGPVSSRQVLRFGLHGIGMDVARLFGGAVVACGLGLAVPILTGKALGEYVPAGEHRLLTLACLAVLGASLVSMAFTLLSGIAVVRIEGRADATLQSAVWDRLLRLPTGFFRNYSTGELANAALGIGAIRKVVSTIGVVAVNAAVIGIVNLGLLLWFSPSLALLACGVLLTHSAVFLFVALRQVRWQRQLVDLRYELSNTVLQILTSMPKLRVAAAENFAYARWADGFVRSRELSHRVRRTQNLMSAINAAYLPFSTLLLFILVAGPAKGTLTVAQFLTFTSAFGATLSAAAQLTGVLSSAAVVVPMYARVKTVLEHDTEIRVDKMSPGKLSGTIDIEHVSFRYSAEGPLILNDVSLHITPGEFVAIVGATGCGKSTLLRLLLGFEQPSTGSIRYDKNDLIDLDVGQLRRQCGVVLQNAGLSTGTVLSNVRGAGRFSMDDAWAAARLAGMDEDIRRMPMGMHTVVSDTGNGFSGGQRQRLIIAQALIRKPPILFFDEATSAVDNDTQSTIMKSTQELNATRVVIAHRLSTVMEADRIVVLADSRIAQSGTPGELMADKDGIFYHLAHRQDAGGDSESP